MLLKKTILSISALIVFLLRVLPVSAQTVLPASELKANVLTSIKPLQLLVEEITGESTEVLVRGAASAHDYSLRPSDLKKMSDARVLFWIGPSMESFLPKVIKKFPDLKLVTLINTEALDLHKGHHHGEGEIQGSENDYELDAHIWLSPANGVLLATEISHQLGLMWPDKKNVFDANLSGFKQKLQQSIAISQKALLPLKQQGFISYHNAWEYWVDYFQLNQLDVVTNSPEHKPGAKQLYRIKQYFKQGQSSCLLLEPGINQRQVLAISRGLNINIGTADPLAINASSYLDWIKQTTGHFVTCLQNDMTPAR